MKVDASMMEDIKIIRICETDSTNRYLHGYDGEEGGLMTVVVAEYQSAGHGQGGSKWESEPGKNLLFSVMTRPERLDVRRQFVMLEAGALAVRDALARYAGGMTVKWPNDVYWHDMKISGTLSECTVAGGLVGRCILGTGVNVNQRKFTGDAPNPVSLGLILDREVDRSEVLASFLDSFRTLFGMVNAGRYDEVDRLYAESLYRREGFHAYRDKGGAFMAAIERIEPDGRLVLRREDGGVSAYMFKEVEAVIPAKG